jgi:MFS family permease
MDKKLFRNKDFLLLWISQITSQLAINIMNFLVLVHIFEQTGSSIASSFIWVAYGVPAVILGPIAAAAVDMYDKRKILIIANITQSIIVLTYALLYQQFLYFSFGVVFLYSVFDQLYVPAEAASLPVVIAKKNLARANGLFFISAQSMAIVGFGMAGLISEVIGFQETMILGSAMLLIAFFATLSLKKLGKPKIASINSFEHLIFQFFTRIKEGYDFIRTKNSILYPFLFLMWLQISLSVLVVNLPAIGIEIVQTKPALAGLLVVGPAGIGALLSAFFLPKLLARKVRKRRIIEIALLSISVNFLVVGTIVPLLGIWTGRLVLITSFFLVGVSYVGALIPSVTFLQLQTPPKLMGRVFGNFWFLANTATLLPVIFSATITEILGVKLMILFMGLIAFSVFSFSKYMIRE